LLTACADELRAIAMSAGPKDRPVLTTPSADSALLDTLFRQEASRLLSYFRRKTGDAEAASDLVQESFVQIARVPRIGDLVNPAAYLQRVARNLLFGRARGPRRAFDRQMVALEEDTDCAHPPQQEMGIEAGDLLVLYEKAVAGLAPKTREIFLMSRRDGMTYKEIQAKVALSMGAVEYHMMRAIAHIDRYLDDHDHHAR
jgi:RNA polymerase sigma-70 factor (ECF subfamily)